MADKASANRVLVYGLVQGLRKVESDDFNGYSHEVVLPAASEFERPAVVEVRCNRKLADRGQVLDCPARLAGYVRKFSYKDKAGDDKAGHEYRGYLLVEGS